ncbi:hypothetical protein HID58_071976 [Brassica napus]|uniref:Uncharacterized protein n=1 Tax=Brassica napus TaxID=3708 RepID=A0ABQ7Z3A4_BRANA|nr:hypothetical protein HID58_071976 [Brassica napus]
MFLRQNKQNDRARVYISATRNHVSPIPSPLSSIPEINAGDTPRQFTVIHRPNREHDSSPTFPIPNFTIDPSKANRPPESPGTQPQTPTEPTSNDCIEPTHQPRLERINRISRDLIQTHNLCHKSSLSSGSSSNQSQIIRPDKRSIGDRTTRGKAGEKDAKGYNNKPTKEVMKLLAPTGLSRVAACQKQVAGVRN